MAERIRVRLGSKPPRYLDATDDKRQTLYVDVAENRRVKGDNGEWTDAEPRWYQAKFDGRDADLIRDPFQQGDALVLFGTKEHRTREFEGKQYKETRFYVESFGVDPRLTTFTIDRSRRATAGPSRDVDQAADQSAIADAEEDQPRVRN